MINDKEAITQRLNELKEEELSKLILSTGDCGISRIEKMGNSQSKRKSYEKKIKPGAVLIRKYLKNMRKKRREL